MKDAAIEALEGILRKAKEYEMEPLKTKLKAKIVTVNPEEEGSEKEEGEGLEEKLSGDSHESHESEGEEEIDDELVAKIMEALK